MSLRPLSQRQHDLPDPQNIYEIRVWDDKGARGARWRTLACCAQRSDAECLAEALVSGAPSTFEFAEIWGPTGESPQDRRRALARFPEPSLEEKHDMWRRAAEQNYSTAYTDLKH